MKYLVDSNIWLERLLKQSRSDEVKEFLEVIPSNHLCISDYSLHSVGVILFKFKEINSYSIFINDLFDNGDMTLLSLNTDQLKSISEITVKHSLDFDDAYQYIVAEQNSLDIVSFDKDFNDTPKGRFEPNEVISKYKK